jgi:hypothetical protein
MERIADCLLEFEGRDFQPRTGRSHRLERGQNLGKDEITARLRSFPEFLSVERLCAQCYHACLLPREEHRPAAPFSIFVRLLDINKSAVRYNAR